MSFLIILLGILMTIGGFICLFSPLIATFGVMYFYMILLFVSGISLIITSISTKRFGVELVFGILTVIIGAFVVFNSYATLVADSILLYIMAGWIILRGIFGIINACQAKSFLGGGLFAFSLIISILVILAGIFAFIHPFVLAKALGIVISCFFIVEGIDLVVSGVIGRKAERSLSR